MTTFMRKPFLKELAVKAAHTKNMKRSFKPILLAAIGLSAVSAVQAQDMLLGFTDTAAKATAHNDYVIDIGAYTLFTTNANLSGSINATTINAAYASVDSSYLNDVSVGAVTGENAPKFIYQTVGFISPLTAAEIGSAGQLISAISVGEYASSSTTGWSADVETDPSNVGANNGISGSVSGDTGFLMEYLTNGVVTETMYAASVSGLRTVNQTILGALKVDLVHDQWTFTGINLVPPVAGFSGTPTNGAPPLKVIFTDASTGNITNWLWSFGDGHSVTNTSNASVTNTYASAGTYNVSLTVTGPSGTNTISKTGYVVVSSGTPPAFSSVKFSSGSLVISGTNGTATTQYRVLMSTNLTSGNWIPVFTNQFLSNGNFSYTNSSTTNQAGFFRLVSP